MHTPGRLLTVLQAVIGYFQNFRISLLANARATSVIVPSRTIVTVSIAFSYDLAAVLLRSALPEPRGRKTTRASAFVL